MLIKNSFLRGLILLCFFSGIAFFVACKAGLVGEKDKKIAPNTHMGGTKSGMVIEPKKDSAPPVRVHSSKSGRIIEPKKAPDTAKSALTDEDLRIIPSTKSGRIFEPEDLKPDTSKPK